MLLHDTESKKEKSREKRPTKDRGNCAHIPFQRYYVYVIFGVTQPFFAHYHFVMTMAEFIN